MSRIFKKNVERSRYGNNVYTSSGSHGGLISWREIFWNLHAFSISSKTLIIFFLVSHGQSKYNHPSPLNLNVSRSSFSQDCVIGGIIRDYFLSLNQLVIPGLHVIGQIQSHKIRDGSFLSFFGLDQETVFIKGGYIYDISRSPSNVGSELILSSFQSPFFLSWHLNM